MNRNEIVWHTLLNETDEEFPRTFGFRVILSRLNVKLTVMLTAILVITARPE